VAKHIPKPFIVRMQAEGASTERMVESDVTRKQAAELAAKLPYDQANRLVYVRSLLAKSLRGELDHEVFKLFVKMTGCWDEVDVCAPRLLRLYPQERKD